MIQLLKDVLPPFFGALVGSGFIWAYLEYKHRRKEVQVSTAVAISELQRDLSGKLIELIALSDEFTGVRDGKIEVANRTNRLLQLKAQIDLLQSHIASCERRLSDIESRQPRPIQVKYIPPLAPTDGSIERA